MGLKKLELMNNNDLENLKHADSIHQYILHVHSIIRPGCLTN